MAEEPVPLAQVEVDALGDVQRVADAAGDGEAVSFIDPVLGNYLHDWLDGQLYTDKTREEKGLRRVQRFKKCRCAPVFVPLTETITLLLFSDLMESGVMETT